MESSETVPNRTRPTFTTSSPRSAARAADPAPRRPAASVTFLAAPARRVAPISAWFTADNRAYVVLLLTALGLIILPEGINYLLVTHTPDVAIEDALVSAETPIAGLARWAGSAALLAVGSAIVVMRGHPNRDITWLFVFLLALNLPYVVGPLKPGPADLIKIVLANVVLVAIWNTGARVAELKWIPIVMSCVGVYSIIGGLIVPEYMMYNMVSRKALVAGWELAGPFGRANALGMYCAIAFALVPLIPTRRWRVICGAILLATIVASATRTALVAAGLVVLWWAVCRLRSVISIRTAGTALAGLSLSIALVFPLLGWGPGAFTGRGYIWAEALDLWKQSSLVGMGFDWFMTEGQYRTELFVWAGGGTGHNILIDTLVKSGLAGVATLLPIWVGAVLATRALRVTAEQIACFGYLIAFFALAVTEAVWDLWPNTQQFPTSALIFATLLLARKNDNPMERSSP